MDLKDFLIITVVLVTALFLLVAFVRIYSMHHILAITEQRISDYQTMLSNFGCKPPKTQEKSVVEKWFSLR